MRRDLLHFDCFSGMAGDMFLGACLDLGLPLSVLEDVVTALALEGVSLEARGADRGGLHGIRFRVLYEGLPIEGPDPEELPVGEDEEAGRRLDGHGRSFRAIAKQIEDAALDSEVRDLALRLFQRLGEAEARVHGVPLDEVHFHEVGAVDALVDIVGAAAAWCTLRPRRATCGPVNVGGGTVRTAHGVLPVPAPATARLLEGIPIYCAGEGELLTPTGAVLLAELVDEFRPLPALELGGVGHGLGRREVAGRPNVFRLLSGRAPAEEPEVLMLETTVDDVSGEVLGALQQMLLEAGALDVFLTPVQMKKARPGVTVSVLCRRAELDGLATRLLEETGSLGCRYHPVGRIEAERSIRTVTTSYGEVRVKEGRLRGRAYSLAPEADDCARLASANGVGWREVYRAALIAAAAPPDHE